MLLFNTETKSKRQIPGRHRKGLAIAKLCELTFDNIRKMKFSCDSKQWTNLLEFGLDFNNSGNTKFDFSKMCKKFGSAYLSYLESAYKIKEEMNDFDFCGINGGIPIGFLEKIK